VTDNYLLYYDDDKYLFEEVGPRFRQTGLIDAFDLFSIISWKAQRDKSKLADRLLRLVAPDGNLEKVAEKLSSELSKAKEPRDRLLLLMGKEWDFYLPMASAILTVLWPVDFTVFDVRVCEELDPDHKLNFRNIGNCSEANIWPRYCGYLEAVRNSVPGENLLRNKDRYLWGRSAARQLKHEIETCFEEARERSTKKAEEKKAKKQVQQ
jgi:hypothetical protein